MEPLELSFTVACSPEHAFAVWATKTSMWWPSDHTVSGSDATEVEVTFTSMGEGTTVRIVHSGWERLGAGGDEMRRRNRQGWAGLLDHYQRATIDLR
jgi:uncharacterized protein YndB with AHSA1/START domain